MAELPPSPGIAFLRRQVVNKMTQLPMSHHSRVVENVKMMDIGELRWTVNATLDQIRWRARQDPDRLNADYIPYNPWWYL